ncbi:hypothetical protein BH23GEM10_BH23GEM10_14510 [soil metagenome]
MPLFLWSRTRGLYRDGHANGVYETQEPGQALAHIVSSQMAALYHFPAFDGIAGNDLIVQRLKDVAQELGERRGALVFTGSGVEFHASVRHHMAVGRLPEPGRRSNCGTHKAAFELRHSWSGVRTAALMERRSICGTHGAAFELRHS